MSTEIQDASGEVRLVGTILIPGATAGDVLTVQADGTLAPETPSGGGAVLSATVTLTDAQIKALPSTPVEIVAAPGEGNMIWPLDALWIAQFEAGYSNFNGGAELGIAVAAPGEILTFFSESVGGTAGVQNFIGSFSSDSYFAVTTPMQTADPLSQQTFPDQLYTVGGQGIDNGALSVIGVNGEDGNWQDGDPANKLIVAVRYSIQPLA